MESNSSIIIKNKSSISITTTVSKGDLISTINQDTDRIWIKAKKNNIDGKVDNNG
ncbi:hypothetical protein [Bacillus pseudomycoides]|uniref:hypothetical protein n=1 Tax=Bacillus pseudomycoides TaxID=64104 RepID=UPI0015CF7DBE|nr:hypothetical protein [Bacillus pseudomycoides]